MQKRDGQKVRVLACHTLEQALAQYYDLSSEVLAVGSVRRGMLAPHVINAARTEYAHCRSSLKFPKTAFKGLADNISGER